MIIRKEQAKVTALLDRHPAVGLLGPRQVGKTTLALEIARDRPSIYLDLESPADRAKIEDPELYFAGHTNELIILDEIQRVPELFQVLRGVIDRGRREGRRSGQFLVLGSATGELLQQSSESLAGRIAYRELTPLLVDEIGDVGKAALDRIWVRGGFPESWLAGSDGISMEWREAFLRTYMEREVPQLGARIPAETLRRFWTMLAHEQGGLFNAAKLAGALAVSGQTVARYLDLMADLLLVRRLPPWAENVGKRLVRSPKVYVRDSGLVHALLGLPTLEMLLGHPVAGQSWEGMVIENLISACPAGTAAWFYRTSAGAEMDLVLDFGGGNRWAVEIKRGLTPKLSHGFHYAVADLKPSASWVVYSGQERYPLGPSVEAVSLPELMAEIRKGH
jgi:predicted AAA+ superfamily ATPase